MGDRDILDLRARVTDSASGPMARIRRSLEETARSPALRSFARDTGNLGVGVRQTTNSLQSMTRALSGSQGVAGGALMATGAVAGATLAVGLLLNKISEVSERATGMRFLGRETNFAVTQLKQLQFTAQGLNIAPDTMNAGLKTFSDRLHQIQLRSREVVNFFERHNAMGFYNDLRAAGDKDPAKALELTISRMKRLTSPHQRGLIAEFMFGNADFARLSDEQFAKYAQMFARIKPTEVDIDAAARFQLQWHRLGAQLESIQNTLLNWSYPAVTSFFKTIGDLLENAGTRAGTLVDNLKKLPGGGGTGTNAATAPDSKENGGNGKPSEAEKPADSRSWMEKLRDTLEQGVLGKTGAKAEDTVERAFTKSAPEVGRQIGKSLTDYLLQQTNGTGASGGGPGVGGMAGGAGSGISALRTMGGTIRSNNGMAAGGGGGNESAPTGALKLGKDKRETAAIVEDEWRRAGMGPRGIAGLMANVNSESRFNPTLRVPDQPKWGGEAHYAHGLYQEGGHEWNQYAAWLKKEHPGSDWRDPRLQSRFAAWRLKTGYPKVWERMQNGTKEEAAIAYLKGYLKPAAVHQSSRSMQYSRGVPNADAYTGGMSAGPGLPFKPGAMEDASKFPRTMFPDPGAFKFSPLDGALKGGKLTGSADIKVEVKAPPGTSVDATANGLFKPPTINRGMQMPAATDQVWPQP